MQNVVYRNGSLYFAYEVYQPDPQTSLGRVVCRWHEVRTNNWPLSPSVLPEIVQTGVIDGGRVWLNDDPSQDRPVYFCYPMLMSLPSGDLAFFLTRIYPRGYVDLVWTARRPSDPAGHTGVPLVALKNGSAGVSPGTHWGEYQGIALDPLDALTVWATGELGRVTAEFPETQCVPGDPSAGIYQLGLHTAIGPYNVPQDPARILTIARQTGSLPPPNILVKVMPPDTGALADVALSDVPVSATRRYGHGSAVTLRAADLMPTYAWKYWKIDGNIVSPPPGSEPRQLVVTMLASHTVTPVYTEE